AVLSTTVATCTATSSGRPGWRASTSAVRRATARRLARSWVTRSATSPTSRWWSSTSPGSAPCILLPVPEDVRVLLCDDHQVFAEALAGLLAADGLQVVGVVGRVGDVVQAAAGHQPHVVLMDYELPDGDGVSACRAVKAVVPDAAVV